MINDILGLDSQSDYSQDNIETQETDNEMLFSNIELFKSNL